MSSENKKLCISIGVLVSIFIGYFGFSAYQHLSKRPPEKEMKYYFELKNEDRLNKYFDENDIISIKNRIQKFLVDYTFTDSEVDTITIEKRMYKKNKNIVMFLLLDDNLESMYRMSYNPANKKSKFEWNGDKDNVEDSCEKGEKPYLYIISKQSYDDYMFNKKISEMPPDEDITPSSDDDVTN